MTIGDGYKAYAFLGYELDHEIHKCLKKSKDMTTMQIQKRHESMVYFILISSLLFPIEEVLPAYYTRQLVEQYFDLSKESSKLTPLRVHSEEAVRGHLLLSMIAATINVYIQKKKKKTATNQEGIFMGLRNQKCLVYKTVTSVEEPQKRANDIYNAFNISCPLSYTKRGSDWVPKFHLKRHEEEA